MQAKTKRQQKDQQGDEQGERDGRNGNRRKILGNAEISVAVPQIDRLKPGNERIRAGNQPRGKPRADPYADADGDQCDQSGAKEQIQARFRLCRTETTQCFDRIALLFNKKEREEQQHDDRGDKRNGGKRCGSAADHTERIRYRLVSLVVYVDGRARWQERGNRVNERVRAAVFQRSLAKFVDEFFRLRRSGNGRHVDVVLQPFIIIDDAYDFVIVRICQTVRTPVAVRGGQAGVVHCAERDGIADGKSARVGERLRHNADLCAGLRFFFGEEPAGD